MLMLAWINAFHMKLFRKLIRDKMPEILAKERKVVKTRVLENNKEYGEWLRRKLLEEVQEMAEKSYDRAFHVERLAYLEELIGIIAALNGISSEEITKTKEKVIIERGSFRKRLLLESVEESNTP